LVRFLVDNGVEFIWETKVTSIDFDAQELFIGEEETFINPKNWPISYDRLMFAVGKSGIDFGKQLADDYKLPTEPKPVQIGVRFEAPQKHFQKLIDISYDFKLYRKFEDKGVSLRSFCTNNNAAYVAVEQTYGDHSYNGHAKKDEKYRNDMTNFGILMEVNGIEEPFKWSRDLVSKVNKDGTGLYYSPTRTPSTTSEGEDVSAVTIDQMDEVRDAFQGYYSYIDDFIEDMKKVFPTLGDDWGVYIPEVKYLSPEPLVNYSDLSLVDYDNVHFVGDALSARGITVSGAQGIYVTDYILESHYPDEFPEFVEHF
jgi:uncharacterized FAD-dependent dehydrogenase